MTKRTPMQERRAALEKLHAARERAEQEFESSRLNAIERCLSDRDKIIQAETDHSLSPEQRLEIFKGLQAWPRIVLGLYQAELQAVSAADIGTPSEIAYEKVGRVVGVSEHRIKALCKEGRRHLRERMPATIAVKMTAAEFEQRILRRRNRKSA